MGYTEQVKHFKTVVPLCAVILFSLLLPLLIRDPSLTSMLVEVLLLTGAAVAWNIFSGYTGYISLGHATYYGLGAYTLTLACQGWHSLGGYEPFLLLPLAGLVAGTFSIPLGWIALRTRRYTFMVVTIAIFFIFQLLAYNLPDITGGSTGIFLPLPSWSSGLYNTPFYYVALAHLFLAIFVSWWIRRSRFGLVLLAIRDDEDRVRGLGIRVGWHKLGAYMLSATFTGMIGALAIYFGGLITPSVAFDQTLDITIVTMTFFGGVACVLGPIVGGLLLEPLQTYLIQQVGSIATGLNQILLGCFLLAVILLLPAGMVPEISKRWQAWMTARSKRILREALQPPTADALAVGPLEPVGSLALQGNVVQSVPLEQPPDQITWSLPLPPGEQAGLLPSSIRFAQRAKAQRLIPIPLDESMASQGQIIATPTISWRCPNCRKPFHLKSGICYCPQCGITRSLTDGKQALSFSTTSPRRENS